jgi:uncharacterized protein YjiS (DUF1127 family)
MSADPSAAAGALPPIGADGGLLAVGVEQLLLWRERAAQRRRLKNLDEHRLADIGRTRAEVQAEMRKPFCRA